MRHFTTTLLLTIVLSLAGVAPAFALSIDAFDPLPEGPPKALAVQPDGRILIASSFQNVAGTMRRGIARLNVDGSVDTSFGDPDVEGEVIAIAVQADGKLLVGGGFTQIAGVPRGSLARLNADGTLDTGFADPALNGSVWAIALQPDGKVFAGGDFTLIGATAQSYLARFTATGVLDTSFPDPQLCCNVVRELALQADGKLLVGGYFSQAGGDSHSYLVRYSAGGVLDAAFPATPISGPTSGGLAVAPDGSIYVAGGYPTSDNEETRLVTRLSGSGMLVTTYDDLHQDGSANAFVLQPNGKLLVAGDFQEIDGQPRHGLARFNADGTLDAAFPDPAFSFDATHPNGSVFGVAAQTDGKVLAVGNFTLAGGQSREYMARVVTGDFATSALVVVGSGGGVTVNWYRLGDGPELAQPPVLEHSTDGVAFSAVGPMTRIANGWQATANFDVHGAPFYLEAFGMTGGGEQNGSRGRVASELYTNDTIFHGDFE